MDNRKCRMKREKRFSSLEAMQVEALELERVEDAYVTYSRTYKVKGIDITITDERIGEAIQFIMPNCPLKKTAGHICQFGRQPK